MEQIFNDYFNHSLRTYLKYPEFFDIKIFEDRVILVPNQTSQLLQIIKNNPIIKAQLITLVQQTLQKHLSNIHEVYITTNNTNISFRIVYESPYQLHKIPEVGIYANIAVELDLQSLNDFCDTNYSISKTCHNELFWIELMRKRFPQYLVLTTDKNKWKKIYKGFLYYDVYEKYTQFILIKKQSLRPWEGPNTDETKKIFSSLFPSITKYPIIFLLEFRLMSSKEDFFKFMSDDHPMFIEYIIKYNILQLDADELSYIFRYASDYQLIDLLIRKYELSANNLKRMFTNALNKNKLKTIKVLMDLSTSTAIINILKDVSIENVLNYNDYSKFLDMVSDQNLELINYFVSQIHIFVWNDIVSPLELVSLLIDSSIPKGKVNIVKAIYRRFKNFFSEKELQVLRQTDKLYYNETGDESMRDIFR